MVVMKVKEGRRGVAFLVFTGRTVDFEEVVVNAKYRRNENGVLATATATATYCGKKT